MRGVAYIGFGLACVCAMLLGLAYWTLDSLSEGLIVSAHYPTYQDAVDDGLFARGWLPNFLPLSARDINVTNNLDLNTSAGSFQIDTADIERFINSCDSPNKPYIYSEDSNRWRFEVNEETGLVTYELDTTKP